MNLAENIIIMFNRWRYQTSPISFYNTIRKPRRVLITLPLDPKYYPFCIDIIDFLKEQSSPAEMEFTSTKFPAGKIAEITRNYDVIYPGLSQHPKFNLPDKDYTMRVTRFMPKIAIDLEPSRSNYNSMIILKSGAAARIGFERGIGMPFYNLEVRSPSPSPVKRRFDDMLDFLQSFFNWDVSPKIPEQKAEV